MIGRCQRQEVTTETDMTEFSQQQKPSTKTGKCLHACLMESIGLVTIWTAIFLYIDISFKFLLNFKIKDGKLSVEKSVHFMSQMSQGNNELVRIVREISEECASIMDSDR